MGNKRISETMRRRYFSTFAAAARELGLVGAASEGYRKSILREFGGVESSSHLTLDGYDRVMAQMASDAKDYATATRYSCNRARRLGYTCEVLAKQLAGSNYLTYIRGVLGRMFPTWKAPDKMAPGWYEDWGDPHLLKLVQALRIAVGRAKRCGAVRSD